MTVRNAINIHTVYQEECQGRKILVLDKREMFSIISTNRRQNEIIINLINKILQMILNQAAK